MKENKKHYMVPVVELIDARVENGYQATGELETLEEGGDATGSFRFS